MPTLSYDREDVIGRWSLEKLELLRKYLAGYLTVLTPLLHKNAVESTANPHQKAVSTLLRITSKGHSWIDPGDDIDLTAIPLWVRVG